MGAVFDFICTVLAIILSGFGGEQLFLGASAFFASIVGLVGAIYL